MTGRIFVRGSERRRNISVVAPLAEAGLTKADIRALAQAAGLRVWDKPASACLSSRIEYGRRVTTEALRQVEDAEEALRALGLRRFRVRHHGSVARIEIAEEEMAAALDAGVFPQDGRGGAERGLSLCGGGLRRVPVRLDERIAAGGDAATGERKASEEAVR